VETSNVTQHNDYYELLNNRINRLQDLCKNLIRPLYKVALTKNRQIALSRDMCDYRRGLDLVNRFIDYLQVVTTNNYYIIPISKCYGSLQRTI
jgi:hypothetical protein